MSSEEPAGPLVIVAPSLRMGGAERVARDQAGRLGTLGPVDFVTLEPAATDFFEPPPSARRRSPARPLGALATLRHVRAACADASAVVAHVDHVALWTLLASLGLRVPVIVVEHISPDVSPSGRLRRVARHLLYRRAHTLVVLTEQAADWHRARGRRAVRVIPNPVEPPASPGPGERPIDVLTMGRLEHVKGIDILVRALADESLTRRRSVRTVVAGSGSEDAALRRLADDLGVEIEFVGPVPDPSNWYHRAKVLALPSRNEGHPLVLLEAMIHGCVPVAADCDTGPAEIVEHDRSGVLVPVESPSAIARAIAALLDDERRLEAMRGAGERRAAEFSIGAVDHDWAVLLRDAGVRSARVDG